MKWEDEDSSDMQECNIELKSLRRHYPDQVRSQNSWVSSQPALNGKHPIYATKLKLIYDLISVSNKKKAISFQFTYTAICFPLNKNLHPYPTSPVINKTGSSLKNTHNQCIDN